MHGRKNIKKYQIIIEVFQYYQQHFFFYHHNAMTNPQALTLNLLTTTIVAPPSNASKWQMGFNSAFKGLNYLYDIRIRYFSPRVSLTTPICL